MEITLLTFNRNGTKLTRSRKKGKNLTVKATTSLRPTQKGLSGSRTRDLSHPKRESYH